MKMTPLQIQRGEKVKSVVEGIFQDARRETDEADEDDSVQDAMRESDRNDQADMIEI